ncbi:hypothetical protein L195_g019031 [Trifolium pratense]|uniref:Uncharacterized protein n=1 Tax=Trifolium pratense TaxID=57577 RepID=A0A2K3MYG6_TRIPR|nr:hypothetical protein L195_g019031 [Trifolium pratense]
MRLLLLNNGRNIHSYWVEAILKAVQGKDDPESLRVLGRINPDRLRSCWVEALLEVGPEKDDPKRLMSCLVEVLLKV